MERTTAIIAIVAVLAIIGSVVALGSTGQNTQDISANADAISNNSDAIDRNSDAIDASESAIASNENSIAENRELIKSNGDAIEAVKANNSAVEDGSYEYSWQSDVYATGYGFEEKNYQVNADVDGYIENVEDSGTIENVKVTLVFETNGLQAKDEFYVGTLESGERRSFDTNVNMPIDTVGDNADAWLIIEGDNIDERKIDLDS